MRPLPRLLAVLTAAGVVVAALLAPVHAETVSVVVSGAVEDIDGVRLPGVSIVSPRTGDRTESRADGTYSITLPSDEPYDVTVCAASGWGQPSPTPADLTYSAQCGSSLSRDEDGSARWTFVLFRQKKVRGTVRDAEGRPIPGAAVSGCRFDTDDPADIEPAYPHDTIADDQGRYELTMPLGLVVVTASRPGYVTAGHDDMTDCGPRDDGTAPDLFSWWKDDLEGVDVVLPRLGDAVTSRHRPYVLGTPNVGWTLTARPGEWNPSDVAVSYRWTVSGDLRLRSTAVTFRPLPTDVGRTVELTVVARKAGRVTARRQVSAGVVRAPAPPSAFVTNVSRPYAAGTPRVGWTLTARPGSWSPSGLSFTFTWLVDGRPVGTAATFRPSERQRGSALSLQVQAARADLAPVSRTVSVGVIR